MSSTSVYHILRITRQSSRCCIRFHSSIRACSRSRRVCGRTLLLGRLSLSHTCSMGLRSEVTPSLECPVLARQVWWCALHQPWHCCAWVRIQGQHRMQQPTFDVVVSARCTRSGKITTVDNKICTTINTDATPCHHRNLSESVAFLDNIWHVLLTMVSSYMLTSIMLCQGKSRLICEQHRSPLAKLLVNVAMGKQKASCVMLLS